MTQTFCDACGKQTFKLRKILSSKPLKNFYDSSKYIVDIKELFPDIEDVCDNCVDQIKSSIVSGLKSLKNEPQGNSPTTDGTGLPGFDQGKVQGDSEVQQGDDGEGSWPFSSEGSADNARAWGPDHPDWDNQYPSGHVSYE